MNEPRPTTEPHEEGQRRLAGGYGRALVAADVFFGGFVILNVALAVISWLRGDAPVRDVIAIGAFLVANVALSEASRRSRRAYLVEAIRLGVAGLLAPIIFLTVSGPLAPWWPGFMVLSLGASIGFGLLTQKPTLGRAVVAYYVVLFLGAALWRRGELDVYQVALWAGVIAMAGLMFAEIMSLLGQALQQEHERSLEVKAARDALFAEVEVAQEIQTLLLPRSPVLEGHEVQGKMVTASEVGGDYYDVIEAPNGRALLAIGDVSGHGVTAGLTMMMARTSLVGAIEAAPAASLAELYSVLNRCMRRNLARMDLGLYMTFALLEHLGNGRFQAVGRHLPILVFRRRSGEVESIELDGMWLGILDELEPAHLRQQTIELEPGDLLFLYTDGIVEQFAGGEMFGFDRLRDVVRRGGAGGPARVIEDTLAALQSFSPTREDDVTMLAVSCVAAAPTQDLRGAPKRTARGGHAGKDVD
jgi:serine phosphatase RsbU (regulator of sigma subunit)